MTKPGSAASVFWRYWTGSTISGVGDAVTAVALPLTAVSVVHASTFDVGLVTAAGYAAWAVMGLPAGVLVSRLPLRGTQIAMDLLRAVAIVSVPVAAWLGRLGVAQLVLAALVISAASVVFDVGNSTLLPSIVTKEQLTARNSLTSASSAATQLGGPSLGGLLVQLVGAATALATDAASYVASALLLRTLPRPSRLDSGHTSMPIRRAIAQGWTFVTRHPIIRPCVIDAAAINFVCGGVLALTPVFLVRTLHAPAGVVGVLMAAEGAGSLAGAAITTRLARRWGSARVLLAAATSLPVMVALIPAAFPQWGLLLFAAGNAGLACCAAVTSILTRTHRQTVTPVDLLPRVMATVRFLSWSVVPLGAMTAAGLGSWVGPRAAFGCVAVAALAAPAVVWLSALRHDRRLDPTGEPLPAAA